MTYNIMLKKVLIIWSKLYDNICVYNIFSYFPDYIGIFFSVYDSCKQINYTVIKSNIL